MGRDFENFDFILWYCKQERGNLEDPGAEVLDRYWIRYDIYIHITFMFSTYSMTSFDLNLISNNFLKELNLSRQTIRGQMTKNWSLIFREKHFSVVYFVDAAICCD